MANSRSTTIKIGEFSKITVSDILWFAEQVQDLPPDTVIRYNHYAGDQRDPGYVTLYVTLPG